MTDVPTFVQDMSARERNALIIPHVKKMRVQRRRKLTAICFGIQGEARFRLEEQLLLVFRDKDQPCYSVAIGACKATGRSQLMKCSQRQYSKHYPL